MAAVPKPLPIGSVIEEMYEIRGVLGHGGAATVYDALRLEDGIEVAVKVLNVEPEDEQDTRRRFFNELLLATRVHHTNIAEIYDFGLLTTTGAPFIVMERLHGQTLWHEIYTRGAFELRDVVPMFLGVLSALGAAHAMGVVHKDLKPSNLFLREGVALQDALVILDFGVASRAGGAASGREYSGTPPYSAPEYIVDQTVSPKIDVYQMGLVIAEAMSGRPVVDSKDIEECFRIHLSGQLPLPPEVVHGPLRAFIERSVAADPKVRFADAQQMYQALAAIPSHLIEELAIPARKTILERDDSDEVPTTAVGRPVDPTGAPTEQRPPSDSVSSDIIAVAPRDSRMITTVPNRSPAPRPESRLPSLMILVGAALSFTLGVCVTYWLMVG